ncbi:MAG: hypothetical protein QW051_00920 [Candidatus Aenigmatarchaeota archaeon]
MGLKIFLFLLIVLLLFQSTHALILGEMSSVQPGSGYKCIYVNLPYDLGLDTLDETSEMIISVNKQESPWADITYNKVVINPGMLNKNPICFYYEDTEEGEFSFYNIQLYSKDLNISKSIFGGFCVSKYEDVDILHINNTTKDVCKLLNENADIFDITFDEDVTQAKPGEIISKKVYITSYANLKIKLSIATNLQNDFGESIVSTSPNKPTVVKNFKIKAPEKEGNFEIIINAQIEGCKIKACKKQKTTTISVNSTKMKKDFSVSVVPQNINLKDARETVFSVNIFSYEDTKDFLIEVSSEPEMEIISNKRTITVEKNEEKTAIFKVIPGNQTLYKIEFKIKTEKSEKTLTSYLSIGELLTDALRYSEAIENTVTPNLREEIRNARISYEEKYNLSSYEESINEYDDFLNTIDELKKTSEKDSEEEITQEMQPRQELNLMFFAIPIIVIIAILLIFLIFKKTRVSNQSEVYDYRYPST